MATVDPLFKLCKIIPRPVLEYSPLISTTSSDLRSDESLHWRAVAIEIRLRLVRMTALGLPSVDVLIIRAQVSENEPSIGSGRNDRSNCKMFSIMSKLEFKSEEDFSSMRKSF